MPTYNELEAAQTLVGLKQDQPKQGSIRNLRNKDIQEEKKEQDSNVKGGKGNYQVRVQVVQV